MRFASALVLSCVAGLSVATPYSAAADTAQKGGAVLALGVKTFSCSAQMSMKLEYLKQSRTETASFSCDYQCVEDFSLTCVDASNACPKLVSVNFDNRRYQLDGKGRGNSVGLDVSSARKGGIERRTGEISFTTDEEHTFQSDPIFHKTYTASGACRPASDSAAARPRAATFSEVRPRRWREE